MYHEYTQDELRSYCRKSIENLEVWARDLIHEKMVAEYGTDYINMKISKDEPLVKKEIYNHIKSMMDKEPGRFKRPVDTLFLDHIVYFLCNHKWYKKLFKETLDYIYPQGVDEAREFLNRLVPIRNPLSHSTPISIRQVEQAICYSHDFIEGLKEYYKDKGEEQVWNVPRIIKIKDSLGNIFDNPTDSISSSTFKITKPFYCGEEYSVELEVDPSFAKDEYYINWHNYSRNDRDSFKNSFKYNITFGIKDIAQLHLIECTIIQKKEWHKHTSYDCRIFLHLTVFPPKQ